MSYKFDRVVAEKFNKMAILWT